MNLEQELNVKEKVAEQIVATEIVNANGAGTYKMPTPSATENPFPDSPFRNTETSILFERAKASVSDKLEINKDYCGVVREITFKDENYPIISVYITISDESSTKNIVEEYSFGGKYDDFNMTKLINFLRTVRNYQLNWVNSQSFETIASSMQFLVGAKVSIVQKRSQNDRTYNIISVLGEYNIELQKVV